MNCCRCECDKIYIMLTTEGVQSSETVYLSCTPPDALFRCTLYPCVQGYVISNLLPPCPAGNESTSGLIVVQNIHSSVPVFVYLFFVCLLYTWTVVTLRCVAANKETWQQVTVYIMAVLPRQQGMRTLNCQSVVCFEVRIMRKHSLPEV